MLSDGAKYASKYRIHQRIRQRSSGLFGRSGGPSNSASMYSIIGVDSVSTRSSCTSAGMVPSGLISK